MGFVTGTSVSYYLHNIIQWCCCSYKYPSLLFAGNIFMLLNSSHPGQDDRYFADDIFICIFVNEKFFILIKTSLKFAPKGPIDNNPALV